MNWINLRAIAKPLAAFLLMVATSVAIGQSPIPAPPALNAGSYLLVDFVSGHEIVAQNPDERVEPASITKLMTSYVVFKELKKGNLAMEDLAYVSKHAYETEGSRMFIEVEDQVSVHDLLKGMIIQSGNDASVALAEHVAGSEDSFADLMNQYAVQLGMDDSSFQNSTGLPAEDHYMSARDVATLSIALIAEFPELYQWYSEKEFTFNGIRQHNRNSLLWRDPAVDGLKTGHTDAAGYCLAASAKRGDMRLISVILGSDSERARADDSQKLINYGFRFYETHTLYRANESLQQVKVWKSEVEEIGVGVGEDVHITIPRGRYESLDASMELPAILTGPIAERQELGRVRVKLGNDTIVDIPLEALQAAPEGGFWRRVSDSIALWFHDV